jgi:serine/threonine-protein kinase PknG
VNCARPGCTGTIVDGYCDRCGMAPARPVGSSATPATVSCSTAPPATSTPPPNPPATSTPPPNPPATSTPPPNPPATPVAVTPSGTPLTATPSSASLASRGSAKPGTTARTRLSARHRLGAGLVEIPSIPFRDPADAVLPDAVVPESRRFCARCDEPVGRSRDGAPGRTAGFCQKCGAPFSFEPQLKAGELVAGQYEVAGCLAHGGMGWVYLARDRNVSDRWVVLKGLLNAGDSDAMAAALAERRFLAEVEHPNIVKIHNFVQHDNSGYIVMEYVGGQSLKQILTARREAAGGEPDPLPAAQAIAYMLEILPALGCLHQLGLLFCDFKIDNVIQTQHSLKLIDLGGVYRIDEPTTAVFGTTGYQAPEIPTAGPSIASDLYTVARTLAVLCFDFRGYQTTYRFTLPTRESVPVLERYDSVYRFLLTGTAPNPDDRFQSADEMAEQLYGVLREVVADQEARPVPATSRLFTGPFRAGPHRPDWQKLPRPQVDSSDPSAGYLATIAATDPQALISQLQAAPDHTVEVDLRIAAAMIEAGDWTGANKTLAAIEAADPWEWRTGWYRGISALATGRPADARTNFTAVYYHLPGELGPKLGLAVACELAGDNAEAATWYEIVARTDPGFTSAAFGLARCRLAAGERAGALAAYNRVPDSSSAYVDAQTARIRCLAAPNGADSAARDLITAGSILDSLALKGEQRARLEAELLEAALGLAQRGEVMDDGRTSLLGCRLLERDLRFGVERSYRELARWAPTTAQRIQLVDHANQVRPRTWT